MKLFKTTVVLIALAVLAFESPHALGQGTENGDFETPGVAPEPFESWTTFPVFTAPVDDGGAALLTTLDLLDDVQLEQTFTLPPDAILLSFELEFMTSDGGTTEPLAANDSFQVTLFDALFDPINPIDPLLPAYYSMDSSGFEDSAPGVTVEILGTDLRRIKLDLSSLPQQEVTLEFLLLGDNDGMSTIVRIDNVSTVVPEPSSLAVVGVLGVGLFARRRTRLVAT
jgi:hypothetical protein